MGLPVELRSMILSFVVAPTIHPAPIVLVDKKQGIDLGEPGRKLWTLDTCVKYVNTDNRLHYLPTIKVCMQLCQESAAAVNLLWDNTVEFSCDIDMLLINDQKIWVTSLSDPAQIIRLGEVRTCFRNAGFFEGNEYFYFNGDHRSLFERSYGRAGNARPPPLVLPLSQIIQRLLEAGPDGRKVDESPEDGKFTIRKLIIDVRSPSLSDGIIIHGADYTHLCHHRRQNRKKFDLFLDPRKIAECVDYAIRYYLKLKPAYEQLGKMIFGRIGTIDIKLDGVRRMSINPGQILHMMNHRASWHRGTKRQFVEWKDNMMEARATLGL